MAILSDEEVFGSRPVLSDDEVFGAAPKADPKIGQPEELTWYERLAAKAPEFMTGNMRGSAVGRAMMGAADPGVAVFQAAANLTPYGGDVNQAIAAKEAEYQAARKGAGSEGFDPMRALGSIAMTAPLGAAGAGAMRGAAIGAGAASLDPIKDGGDSFWWDKLKQAGMGAAGGAVMSPVMGGLARLVSPKASVNESVKLLQSEGVKPTVGQAAGGWASAAEEKLTSLPIVGDAIKSARNRAIDQFNEAAINRTVKPIGGKVSGFGQDAVAEAGDKLSGAYKKAFDSLNHVNFATPTMVQKLGDLEQMAASSLTGGHHGFAAQFSGLLDNLVAKKISPNGSMLPDFYKKLDSELGQKAATFMRSSVASEQEFGQAIKQLQTLFRDEVATQNPAFARALSAADSGWANLVRIEGAAKAGLNNEGRFTPAQLLGAIRRSDNSVRDRATARGSALMQDLGTAGQTVLGSKVPDSGTVGRAAWGAGALGATLGSGGMALPAALIGGAAMYSPPVQNALVALLTRRPESAPFVANYLRQLTGYTAAGAGSLTQEFR